MTTQTEKHHHELASAGPQAIALLAAGAAIYGSLLVQAITKRLPRKGGRR